MSWLGLSPMGLRHRALLLTLVACVATGALAFCSVPALAVNEYPFAGQLTGELTPQTSFARAESVAVDDVTGDILVADSGPDVVHVFDSSGNYITTWTGSVTPIGSFGGGHVTVAVNNATGDVYVMDISDGVVDILSYSGAYLGQLTGTSLVPGAVAVNQASGAIYVIDEEKFIDVFDASGAFRSRFADPAGSLFRNMTSIAVDDTSGNLLVAGVAGENFAAHGVVHVLTATGALVTEWAGANTPSGSLGGGFVGGALNVAVNESSGDVYIGDAHDGVVDQFSSSGVYLGQITGASGASFGSVAGVAVGQASQRIYVADTGNSVIDVFGAPVLEPLAPSIDGTSASKVGPASADLGAEIDPNGFDTSYRFEYGTGTYYGANAPVVDEQIGSATIDQVVSAHLSGLQPDTTYHYRVVARNVNGVTVGIDHTFVYSTAPGGLPDGRAYEMVTPRDKQGALVDPVLQATVAADGSSLAGESPEGFAGLENDELAVLAHAFYRFTRTASGWSTTPLNPPRGLMMSIGIQDSVWGPAASPAAPARLRLRQVDGSLSEIGPVWSPARGAAGELPPPFGVPGAAGDASDGVLFTINQSALRWPFDTTLGGDPVYGFIPSLYEYRGTGNAAPGLVGVSGGAGSTTLISQCATTLGSADFVSGPRSEYNAVSEDGSTVFFTAAGADSVSCGGVEPPVNELFSRIGGSRTVAVSEPSAADCPTCDTSVSADAVFRGASADGSKVFFTTTQTLLGADASEGLYEYDFSPPPGEPKVVRVSAGDATVSGPAAEVQGVVRISEDGSHVYFVARGVLTGVASGEGVSAQAGADNLYVYERDAQHSAGQTTFIADLCTDAAKSGAVSDSRCPRSLSPEGFQGNVTDERLWGSDQNRPAQATPDGRFLVFTSSGDLTTGDTSSARQVFQYDAQANRLVRVSIGLDGYNDNGNAADSNESNNDAGIAVQEYAAGTRGGVLARTMSDDGSYVFFQSPVGLTPQALNDVTVVAGEHGNPVYAQNVYEYHEGRVSLIGSDASPTLHKNSGVLIGASASGGDVFFGTADRLVAQDGDTQVDFYDARIGGGFPVSVGLGECQGDPCQGPPGTPPSLGAPSSTTVAGGGNVAPAPSNATVKRGGSSTAQRLARALRACARKPTKHKRRVCKVQARKRYAHSSNARTNDRRGK